jgi:GTP cyclohydrolase I
MKDVQNFKDTRNIPIDKVGVKGILYPITVKDKAKESQNTVANVNMYVELPHHFKGTHMSRFIEVLNEYKGSINMSSVSGLLDKVRQRLDAKKAHIELEFPFFIEKKAPVSSAVGYMDYTCRFFGEVSCNRKDFILNVNVPVTSLCPCSKEISSYGAHNQRSVISISIRMKKFIWIEDLIKIAESSSSCQIYSVLKREDEKYVTEKAYDNPMFVEDTVREIALRLNSDDNITWYKVESENFESIHNHSAYASITLDKRKK